MQTAATTSTHPSSHQMPQVMRVIDEIAFHTSLMALQSAVAAAEADRPSSSEHAQGTEPDGNAGR
jgi:hypothetical protein